MARRNRVPRQSLPRRGLELLEVNCAGMMPASLCFRFSLFPIIRLACAVGDCCNPKTIRQFEKKKQVREAFHPLLAEIRSLVTRAKLRRAAKWTLTGFTKIFRAIPR